MLGETLFISDLHLNSEHLQIQQQFLQFIDQDAMGSDALYILGDLFEVWLGDDDDNPGHQVIIQKLKQLSDQGTPVYIQHGNRDFLLGQQFESLSGASLLPDPDVLDVFGQRVLIMHGDLLCTDDIEYQKYRQMTRDPQWQTRTLELPVSKRKELANNIRSQSEQQKLQKSEDIMDVNPDTVNATLLQHNCKILVHGHTHRPAIHQINNKQIQATRIVLGDWYDQGSVLRWNKEGYKLETLSR